MVSCSKRILALGALFFVVSCGQDGVAPLVMTNPRIFVTGTVNPNFSGATGGDDFCKSQAQSKGLSGNFKALVVSGARTSCTTADCSGGISENKAWVLKPNTTYYREDGTTVIGTTTSAGIFSFPLEASIGTTPDYVWTGIDSDWTTKSNEQCSNWYSTSSSGMGSIGLTSVTDSNSIQHGWTACNDTTIKLLCVEQIGKGPSTAADPAPTPPCTTCKIFVTSQTFNGNLGGTSGADTICNNDAQSGSDVYKALLGTRNPLYANTAYTRPDGTPIGTTNGSGQFTFPLTNSITAGSSTVWTGIAANWADFNTCGFWYSGSGSNNSNIGDSSSQNTGMLNSQIVTCQNTHALYCVQQY